MCQLNCQIGVSHVIFLKMKVSEETKLYNYSVIVIKVHKINARFNSELLSHSCVLSFAL